MGNLDLEKEDETLLQESCPSSIIYPDSSTIPHPHPNETKTLTPPPTATFHNPNPDSPLETVSTPNNILRPLIPNVQLPEPDPPSHSVTSLQSTLTSETSLTPPSPPQLIIPHIQILGTGAIIPLEPIKTYTSTETVPSLPPLQQPTIIIPNIQIPVTHKTSSSSSSSPSEPKNTHVENLNTFFRKNGTFIRRIKKGQGLP